MCSREISGLPSNFFVKELLSTYLLPRSWTFGRSGQVRHVLMQSPEAKTIGFDGPVTLSKHRRIVELLADGKQIMLPGSVHPNGESIEWLLAPDDTELVTVTTNELQSRIQALAGAALLARLWPDLEGSRHEVVLALAGALYHAGWPRHRIEKLLVALLRVVDDGEKKNRVKALQSTLDAAAAGHAITGLPRLSELLSSDSLQCLVKWWQLGHSGPVLTFGGQSIATLNSTNEWPELLEFEAVDYCGRDHSYPVDALGKVLAPAVQALADRQQVPIALAAQSVLVAAASVTQQYYDVLLDGRRIPLSLWLVLVAEPGERKTSTDTLAFARLNLRQREAEQRYRVVLDGWKTARNDKETDSGPRPRKPCWLLSDCTTEGLLRTLDKHWPALTLTNSDAGAWLAGYSMREGRDSATAAVLSQLWSGAAHSMARASLDEPVSLVNRRLSLSLMLQTALAAQLFDNNTLAGQGFLSRCLPSFPVSLIGRRFYRPVNDDTGFHPFFDAQDPLLTHPPPMNLETGELELTSEAKQRWISTHDRYEAALAGDYTEIREVANKAPEQVVRLAGVMAVMEGASQVQLQHINNADRLLNFYLQEWQNMALKLVSHRKEIEQPRQLLEWMQKHHAETGRDRFNLVEVYRSGPRLVRNQSQLARDLMTELLRRGYVRLAGKDYQLRLADKG